MTSPESHEPPASESEPRPSAPIERRSRAVSGLLVAAAALIAVAISGPAGEAVDGRFVPGLVTRGGMPTNEESLEDARRYRNGVTTEAMIKAALLGGALGLTLGAAGGLARRNGRAAAVASIFGVAAGSAVAAVAAFGFVRFYLLNFTPTGDELPLALGSFGGSSALLGAAAGSAFGVGLGGRQAVLRALLGGMIGAVLGMMIFQVVGAFAFPLEDATKPLPSSMRLRLLSQILVALFTAAGAFLVAANPPRPCREPVAASV